MTRRTPCIVGLLGCLAVASLLVLGLFTATQARAADSQDACADQLPDPKAFVISSLSMEGTKGTGALTDVYFSVKNVAGPDVGILKFLATFSKRGEIVKTARFNRFFMAEPLRKGDVEQIHWDESRIGGFCDANMSACGSVTIRVVGVCYDRRGSREK